MAKNILVNSKKTNAMGKENSDGRMVVSTKVNGPAESSMESVYIEMAKERKRKASG